MCLVVQLLSGEDCEWTVALGTTVFGRKVVDSPGSFCNCHGQGLPGHSLVGHLMDKAPRSFLDHPVVSLSLWHMGLSWSIVCTELVVACSSDWIQCWLEFIVCSDVSDRKPTPVMSPGLVAKLSCRHLQSSG